MTAVVTRERHSPEDLLSMPDGDRYELVHGELVERNMGTESSWIGGALFARLWNFNAGARLGHVLPADTGYQCFDEDPARVRKPDASFIPLGRLPGERLPRGHARAVPALVVEVISPNDGFSEV